MRALLLVSVWAVACGSLEKAAKVWEDIYRPVLLDGYSDFRAVLDGTDDGYIVISYKLPDDTKLDSVISHIRTQIVSRFPCYSTVSEDASRLVLRCPGGRPRQSFRWDEEYHVVLDHTRRRVFMLVIDSVTNPRYTEILGTLDEARRASR